MYAIAVEPRLMAVLQRAQRDAALFEKLFLQDTSAPSASRPEQGPQRRRTSLADAGPLRISSVCQVSTTACCSRVARSCSPSKRIQCRPFCTCDRPDRLDHIWGAASQRTSRRLHSFLLTLFASPGTAGKQASPVTPRVSVTVCAMCDRDSPHPSCQTSAAGLAVLSRGSHRSRSSCRLLPSFPALAQQTPSLKKPFARAHPDTQLFVTVRRAPAMCSCCSRVVARGECELARRKAGL